MFKPLIKLDLKVQLFAPKLVPGFRTKLQLFVFPEFCNGFFCVPALFINAHFVVFYPFKVFKNAIGVKAVYVVRVADGKSKSGAFSVKIRFVINVNGYSVANILNNIGFKAKLLKKRARNFCGVSSVVSVIFGIFKFSAV